MFQTRQLGITRQSFKPTSGIGALYDTGAPCPGTPGCPGNPINISSWESERGGSTFLDDLWNLPQIDRANNPLYTSFSSLQAPDFWTQYGKWIAVGAAGLLGLTLITGRRR